MDNKKARVNLTYYIIVATLLITHITISTFSDNMSSNQINYSFTFITQIICMLTLPVLFYFAFINKKAKLSVMLEDFGFKKFKKGELLKVIALGFLAIYINTFVANINYTLLEAVGYTYSSSASSDYISNIGLLFADLVMTAMLPAICEETAHRGLFRTAYRYEPVKYILLSSLMFALMHQNIAQVLYTFVMGIFFASAVLATGNLKASMVMHFMINATEVLGDFGAQTNNIFFSLKNILFNVLYSNVIGRLIAVNLLFVCIYLFIKILFSFRNDEFKRFSFGKIPEMKEAGIIDKNGFLAIKANGYSKLFLGITVTVGIVCNIFTLTWGIMR